MKHINLKAILFCITIICSYSAAYAQPGLTFQYDAAGNQIERQWICINCTQQQLNSIPGEIITAFNDSEFSKKQDEFAVVRLIKAFPNPVAGTLKVELTSNNGVFIKSLEVFSLTGARVYHGKNITKQDNTTISFLNMIPGGYILRAEYSDGKRESLRIMKL